MGEGLGAEGGGGGGRTAHPMTKSWLRPCHRQNNIYVPVLLYGLEAGAQIALLDFIVIVLRMKTV